MEDFKELQKVTQQKWHKERAVAKVVKCIVQQSVDEMSFRSTKQP